VLPAPPSAGSPPEVPAASPAQEGSDTDEAVTTTPNVSELQPTMTGPPGRMRSDASEERVHEPQILNAP
jgi:hypothetical protein